MSILIIGNGFDLAHGLPTSYKDFMKFLIVCKSEWGFKSLKEIVLKQEEESLKSKFHSGNLTKYEYDGFVSEIGSELNDCRSNYESIKKQSLNDIEEKLNIVEFFNEDQSEIKKLISGNFWIDYFEDIFNEINGEGWIDFEKEISTFIQNKESLVKSNICKTEIKGNITKDDIREIETEKLSDDLERFTRVFEIYLNCFIVNKEISLINSINELPDIYKVLSFNYTYTYNKYVPSERDVEFDFIHGKVRSEGTKNRCNMILGIDEYLEDKDKNSELDFIKFKKYFQRIYKKTGNEYTKWIEDNNSKASKNSVYTVDVYIIGHSLDVTDKDILNEFLLSKWSKVIIYYHNEEAHAQQIKNVVTLIGQESLIRMTGGNRPKIIFKQFDQRTLEEYNHRVENKNIVDNVMGTVGSK